MGLRASLDAAPPKKLESNPDSSAVHTVPQDVGETNNNDFYLNLKQWIVRTAKDIHIIT